MNTLILLAVVMSGAILAWPRVANAPFWRATVTPLASIIGSGFLVLGPTLTISYGGYAPLVMVGLCAVAYLLGGAIRSNIRQMQSKADRPGIVLRLETASAIVLAFSYFISVAYYLNLFGSFGVSMTELDDSYHANLLTSAVFILILLTGWLRGFSALERMEQVSVGLKLAIIAGLLVGLAGYFAGSASQGDLHFDPPQVTGWAALTLAAGLIVTVQGFETSRYLGAAYDPTTRIRSMRLAQWLSTAIYCVYILLLTYALEASVTALDETAIIDLLEIVAPVLPVLLIVAALSAQFSAAIADTSGSGGLLSEVTKGRISANATYALLVGLGLLLTWTANVFEIISYASRAFAIYYALQSLIAAVHARADGRWTAAAWYFALALFAGTIAAIGTPVE